jgi:hypothetical protein
VKDAVSLQRTAVISAADLDFPPCDEFDRLVVTCEAVCSASDPLATLKGLRSLLTAEGRVVAHLPNLQHWRRVLSILRDRFDLRPAFTLASARRLFTDAGYEVLSVEHSRPFSKLASPHVVVTARRA